MSISLSSDRTERIARQRAGAETLCVAKARFVVSRVQATLFKAT